jgi:hypothetical protein
LLFESEFDPQRCALSAPPRTSERSCFSNAVCVRGTETKCCRNRKPGLWTRVCAKSPETSGEEWIDVYTYIYTCVCVCVLGFENAPGDMKLRISLDLEPSSFDDLSTWGRPCHVAAIGAISHSKLVPCRMSVPAGVFSLRCCSCSARTDWITTLKKAQQA